MYCLINIFIHLKTAPFDPCGELQLSEAVNTMAREIPNAVFAFFHEGERFDCGSKLGYLELIISFALKDQEKSKDTKNLISR